MDNVVKRMKYQDVECPKGVDFRAEQDYHCYLRQLHNSRIHSPGIVAGLKVVPGDKKITIAKGLLAIDAKGRELILAKDLVVPVDQEGTIGIRYKEADAGISKGENGAVKAAIPGVEAYWVTRDQDAIAIAKIVKASPVTLDPAFLPKLASINIPGDLTVSRNLTVRGLIEGTKAHLQTLNPGPGPVDGLKIDVNGTTMGPMTPTNRGLLVSMTGPCRKIAAVFEAVSNPADEDGRTHGVQVHAEGRGGEVSGVTASAVGGPMHTIGISGSASGIGYVYGGSFAATNETGPGCYGIHSTATGKYAYAGFFKGNVGVIGTIVQLAGFTIMDHPLDPNNKLLRHGLVQSPEQLCLYRGKVQLDAAGTATVNMPSYFTALTKEDEATVQLTAIGAQPFLAGYEWNGDFTAITVHGEPNRQVAYMVLADRDDPAMNKLRQPVEQDKDGFVFHKGGPLLP